MKKITDYKNIVFDAGGVLIEYNAFFTIDRFTDDKEIAREVYATLFCSHEWLGLDAGIYTEKRAMERLLPRFSNDHVREIGKKCFEHWHEYSMVKIPEMEEVIKALKDRGQRAYVLSNAPIRCAETYINCFPCPDLFDGVMFSAEVMAIKPQRYIYEDFFKRFGLLPEESFFIDDMPENIQGAKNCGMEGYIYEAIDVEKLKKVLELE